MMSRFWILVLMVVFFSFPRMGWGSRDFGVGILLGQPSGLKATFALQKRIHLDFTAAWSWNDWMLIMSDCKFEDYISPRSLYWRWYYGLGAYGGVSNDSDREAVLGVRVPIGVSYQFPYTSLEVFGELVPAMQIIEETRGRFHCGVGILIWL